MVAPARLCLVCKGRNLCGHSPCPLLKRLNVESKVKGLSESFFGPSEDVFIGRAGYPSIGAGPLGMINEETRINNPQNWLEMEYSDIIYLRSLVLRTKQKENIFSSSRFVSKIQEISLSKKPVDVEMEFKKKPFCRMGFSDIYHPIGPTAELKKLEIAENPKIPRKTESVVNDEIGAKEASFMLYKQGNDVYKITTILSSGALGIKRRLVPTRWSITAADDMIFKEIIKSVKEFPVIDKYLVYSNESLNNHFEILLIPDKWEFENFEAWAPGSFWSFSLKSTQILREYEPYKGRKDYAELQGGGYYASRFAVAESLFRMKRQAKVVVFREVYEGYVIPLGVWQVRENIRKAFQSKPEKFDSLKDALLSIDSRLRISTDEYKKQSIILSQKKINDFWT